jgi:hypothetical protein
MDRIIISNRKEFEICIKSGIFDFTMEELDNAENSEDGFIGERNGTKFYLSKNNEIL